MSLGYVATVTSVRFIRVKVAVSLKTKSVLAKVSTFNGVFIPGLAAAHMYNKLLKDSQTTTQSLGKRKNRFKDNPIKPIDPSKFVAQSVIEEGEKPFSLFDYITDILPTFMQEDLFSRIPKGLENVEGVYNVLITKYNIAIYISFHILMLIFFFFIF